jgi:hypothetical protein
MRLVKVFEGGGDAFLGLRYDLRFGQVALCLFRFEIRHINLSENQGQFAKLHCALASFLLLSAFLHAGFPAVPAWKPAVVKAVALLAGNLETDETEAFFGDNGLLTFVTDDEHFEFHSSPLQLSWLSL